MDSWTELCSPAKVYIIFMSAVVFFDMYLGQTRKVLLNIVYLVFGTGIFYTLCAANMDFVGWLLLAVPILFYIFVVALWVFDQSLYTLRHGYKIRKSCEKPCEEPEPACTPEKPKNTC
jgi:hypothetical protein